MSNPKFSATVNDYPGGRNAVIEYDGKRVSATKTDYGYFSVEGEDGEFVYNGKDQEAAADATRDYLTNG